MPLVTWLVFDNITRAQQVTDQIGAFCKLVDGSNSFTWGPVYEDLDAVGGAKYAVEFNSTLVTSMNPVTPKTWTVEATLENNPKGVLANIGDPMLSAEDIGHLEEIEFDDFVEHDYSVPPEEGDPE
jgi:hypothetical protein